jgi:hypothetical protein
MDIFGVDEHGKPFTIKDMDEWYEKSVVAFTEDTDTGLVLDEENSKIHLFSGKKDKTSVTKADERKGTPIYSGCLRYFPDALREVSRTSKIGNDQHNPGQSLHWAKEKSTDHADALVRHLMDHEENPYDDDGALHLAKVAWRALAHLQTYLENRND